MLEWNRKLEKLKKKASKQAKLGETRVGSEHYSDLWSQNVLCMLTEARRETSFKEKKELI